MLSKKKNRAEEDTRRKMQRKLQRKWRAENVKKEDTVNGVEALCDDRLGGVCKGPKHSSREHRPLIRCPFGVMATNIWIENSQYSVLRHFVTKLNSSFAYFNQLGKWLGYLEVKSFHRPHVATS